MSETVVKTGSDAASRREGDSGPYLHDPLVGAGSASVVVSMYCASPRVCGVEYGETDELGRVARSSKHGLIDAGAGVHNIVLKGLRPGRPYWYRFVSREITDFGAYKVEYGKTFASKVASFTLPETGAQALSVLCLNDLHGHGEFYRPLLSAAYASAKKPDLVVLNGDMLDCIDDEIAIRENLLAPCAETFATETPFVFVRGNHETRGEGARSLDTYALGAGRPFYRSFTLGGVFFLVVDTGEDKADDDEEYSSLADFDRYRAAQARALRRAVESKACAEAKFRVCFAHTPVSRAKGDGWHGTLECGRLFAPLLERGTFHLAVSGHTHQARLIRPGPDSYHIAIGGGHKRETAAAVRLDVGGDTLRVALIDLNGAVLDECSIPASGSRSA